MKSQNFSYNNNNYNKSKKESEKLPRTVATRKGALMLFSEEFVNKSSRTSNNRDSTLSLKDLPIKTVNELQRNVLFYGLEQSDQLNDRCNKSDMMQKNENIEMNNQRRTSFNDEYIPFKTFSILNLSTKNLLNSNSNDNNTYVAQLVEYNEETDQNINLDKRSKRINRGFSARHYLRSLTKNWDQKLLDTFISDGKINQETIYLKNDRLNKKKRVEEDLSVWPQAYKFDNSYIHATIDMKTYKFIKAQEFYLNKSNKDENKIETSDSNSKNKHKLLHEDPIKIFDQKLTEVSYKSLNIFEKQKVLTEILFQSALNNLKRHRINTSENIDLKENSKIQFQLNNYQPNILNKEITVLSSKKKATTYTPNVFEPKISKLNCPSKLTIRMDYEPVYMFGRYSGAPWVKLNNKDQLTKESNNKESVSLIKSKKIKNKVVLTPNSMESIDDKKNNIIVKHNHSVEKVKLMEEVFKVDLTRNMIMQENEIIQIVDKIENNENIEDEYNLDIKIETNMNQENFNAEFNKFSDDFDNLLSIRNGLDSEEKFTKIEMEELKSIKSGSEQFLLKESRNSINRDEKSKEDNLKLTDNSKIKQKLSDKINIKNDQTYLDNHLNLEEFQQQDFKEFKKDSMIESVKSEKKKYEFDHNQKKENQLKNMNQDQHAHILIHASHIHNNFRNNNSLLTNSKILDKQTKNQFKKKSNNINLIFKEKMEPLPQLKKPTVNHHENNEEFKELSEENNYKNIIFDNTSIETRNLNLNLSKSNLKKVDSFLNIKQDQTLQKPVQRNIEDNILLLPKLNNETLNHAKLNKSQVQELNYNEDYAKVETMKLKPKSNLFMFNNTENLKRKFGFDNTKMLMKRNDIEINFGKQNKTKDTINKPVISEKLSFLEKKTEYYNQIKNEDSKFEDIISDQKEDLNAYLNYNKPKVSNMFEKETIGGKQIDWAYGNFDPRSCFVLWSYNPPIVIDKEFAESLKKYAQLIARTVLGKKNAGNNLSEDLQKALYTNLEKLKIAIEHGKIGREVVEEYKKVFTQMLAKTLRRKVLQNIKIDDEILIKLLEFPPHAFEIYFDPVNGVNKLRLKPSFIEAQDKLVRTIVTEKNISMNDLEIEINPVTGEKKFKLKSAIARKLGIPEGYEDLIEFYKDENGNQILRLKDGAKTVKIGDTEYELTFDQNTGQYVLKMTNKQKVGEETLEDIMKLAGNMSPETRHRYFQELLKTSGATMTDDMRKNLISEMINNSNNLALETRDNFLKDLMVNLVNTLPGDLAKKVLGDIMNSTNNLNSSVKEQMIKSLLQDLDELPPVLKEKALLELINNMDDLSFEVKHNFLNEILNKVQELNDEGSSNIDMKLKNDILKEMIKNSQNFDEETRNKIFRKVIENNAEMSASLLEELVKHIDKLPDELKNNLFSEIKHNIISGGLNSDLLSQLLKNPNNLSSDILSSIVNHADKMDSSTLKELMKNLDKIPDALKEEIIFKLVDNLNTMDQLDKNDLLKKLISNSILIKDEKIREELLKNIISKLEVEDILKETENMTADEKHIYLQNLLKHSTDLSDDVRKKIISLLLENSKNLNEMTRENLLKDLVEDVIKTLPPEIGSKLLAEVIKSAQNLDPTSKKKIIENLLFSVNDLPAELKQNALQEMISNLDDMMPDQKAELLKAILNVADSLPSELKNHTMKILINNLDNLSSEQKYQLFEYISDKLNEDDNQFSQEFKHEILKEIVKKSKDLDEETRTKVFKNVIEKYKIENGVVTDKVLDELIKQMNSMPVDIKNTILQNNIEKENKTKKLNNLNNIPKELVEKIVTSNLNQIQSDTLKELIKNLDHLPDELKSKAIEKFIENIESLDQNSKKELLKELMTNPNLIKDKKILDKAILDIVTNLDQMSNDVKKDVLKNIAKNISKLSNDAKKKVLNEVFNHMKNNDETNDDLLKHLLKNMGQKDLEEFILGSDISEELKQKMLADLNQIINNGDLLESDDERELVGLSGEERRKKKKTLVDKKRGNKDLGPRDDEKPNWQDSLRNLSKEKKDIDWLTNTKIKVLKDFSKDIETLNEDQIDFIKVFNQLSEEEKAKLIESMNREERYALNKLQDEFAKLRQKELEDALLEAKRAAIAKLREDFARKKKLQYINFLRIEANMFNHSQQISRAFVFSYFDILGWLDES